MKQKDRSLISKMNIENSAIIVNQTDKDSSEIINYENNSCILWIDSLSKGLSVSRNLALKNSNADICHLADDDLIYMKNYKEVILKAFDRYKDADIIAFIVDGRNGKFKSYSDRAAKLNYVTSMKVSSVQIAFRRKSLVDNGISFREEFGSGAYFYAGEENILLYDCLKAGLRIYFVPEKIAEIYLGGSSWFEGFNKHYFITKGAAFTAMSRFFSDLLILQFAIRKIKLYKNDTSILNAIRYMYRGKKEFLLKYSSKKK